MTLGSEQMLLGLLVVGVLLLGGPNLDPEKQQHQVGLVTGCACSPYSCSCLSGDQLSSFFFSNWSFFFLLWRLLQLLCC